MRVQISDAVVMVIAILLLCSSAGQTMCANCLNANCTPDGVCNDGCKRGFYGDECNRPCRNQCVESRCHISLETGSAACDSGCIPGFRGRYCERKCPRRCVECNNTMCYRCTSASWYGPNCSAYCSHCNDASCYKNGTCKRGCTERNVKLGCSSEVTDIPTAESVNEKTMRGDVYDKDDDDHHHEEEEDKTLNMLLVLGPLMAMFLVSCIIGVSLWQRKERRQSRHNATTTSPVNTNHVSQHHWNRMDRHGYLTATHVIPTEEVHIYEEIPSD